MKTYRRCFKGAIQYAMTVGLVVIAADCLAGYCKRCNANILGRNPYCSRCMGNPDIKEMLKTEAKKSKEVAALRQK